MAVFTLPFSLLMPSQIGLARSNENVVFSDAVSVTEPDSLAATADEEVARAFKDIEGHWAEESIREAIASGLISGYADGTFKPDHTLTVVEFAEMLTSSLRIPILIPTSAPVSSINETEVSSSSSLTDLADTPNFSDVPSSSDAVGSSGAVSSLDAVGSPEALSPTSLVKSAVYNGHIQSLRDVGIVKENELTSDQWQARLTRSVLISLSLRVIDPELTTTDELRLEQRAIAAGLLDSNQELADDYDKHGQATSGQVDESGTYRKATSGQVDESGTYRKATSGQMDDVESLRQATSGQLVDDSKYRQANNEQTDDFDKRGQAEWAAKEVTRAEALVVMKRLLKVLGSTISDFGPQ